MVVQTITKKMQAIDMKMRNLDPYDPAVANRMMHGLSNEAGGGGFGARLARDLRVLSLLSPIMMFLDVIFYLHGHVLAFKCPVEK